MVGCHLGAFNLFFAQRGVVAYFGLVSSSSSSFPNSVWNDVVLATLLLMALGETEFRSQVRAQTEFGHEAAVAAVRRGL